MTRFTIRLLPGTPVAALVTARDGNAETWYDGITLVQIEIDAPRSNRRIALKSGAETILVLEGASTQGFDPPGVRESRLLLSAYDSLAGRAQTSC